MSPMGSSYDNSVVSEVLNYTKQKTFHESCDCQVSYILYETASVRGLVSLQNYVSLTGMLNTLVELACISILWARLRLQGRASHCSWKERVEPQATLLLHH